MIRTFLIFLIDYFFFNRFRATFICMLFMSISFFIEINCSVKGFFSASGTLFTVAGLFLNIKLTGLFHRKQMINGKKVPLNTDSKYSLIVGTFGFASNTSQKEKEARVKDVESDEICGVILMILGTFLWGYGSYLIDYWIK